MKDLDYLVATYRAMPGMMQAHVGDFSDADMLVRPVPGANHAAWQLGHLVNATTNIPNLITPGAMPGLPQEFSKKYGKEGSKLDTGFDSKNELLKKFAQAMEDAAAWLMKLTDDDKAKPAPDRLRGLAPTVGGLTQVMPFHITMHIGQIQVIRRKLGKPVLF